MRSREPTGVTDMSERLRVSRMALKLTQARLCRLATINPQAWNMAEQGNSRIGLSSALRLCQATGLTLDWIYRGSRAGLPLELAEAISREEAKLDRVDAELKTP